MFTYTVTAGRNFTHRHRAAPQLLSDSDWQGLQDAIHAALLEESVASSDVLEVSTGVGAWQGIEEPNVSFTLRTRFRLNVAAELRIEKELRRLAQEYRQDAIAFSVGTSRLVFA